MAQQQEQRLERNSEGDVVLGFAGFQASENAPISSPQHEIEPDLVLYLEWILERFEDIACSWRVARSFAEGLGKRASGSIYAPTPSRLFTAARSTPRSSSRP